MSVLDTIQTALFGDPPQPGWKPDRAGVVAAFSELLQLVSSSGLDEGIYETTAAGIAATTNGTLFLVKGTGDSFADLYKNVSGSAVAQGISLPNTAFVSGKADAVNPLLTGTIILRKPADSGLAGDLGIDISGTVVRIYERGGTARGFSFDIASALSGAGSPVAPTIDPVFIPGTGAPANVGGRIRIKRPTTTELAGDLAIDITGSSLRVYEGGGTGRGFSVNIAALSPNAGSEIAIRNPVAAWTSDATTGISAPIDPDIINVVLIWGQSNAEANTLTPQTLVASAPLNSTVAPYVLMGDCGARLDIRVGNTDKPNPTGPVFNDLVPCHEAINTSTLCYETALTSALTHIHQYVYDATGLRTTWAGAVIARGGYSVKQLKQGTGAFEFTRQWLADAVRVAGDEGKRIVVRGIMFCCTETDATNNIPAPMLAETYVELASAANALVKSISGQTEDLWFFLDGAQSPDLDNRAYNDLVEGQRIASERCSLIKLGAPYYQHPRTSIGSPENSIHVNARGQNNTGTDYARVITDMLSANFAPAQPYFARLSNVARTDITVQCPYAPAVDTSDITVKLAGLKGRYGIVFEDDSGAAPAITAHSISGNNITFTLASVPTGPNPRLIIGQMPNDTGDPFGPVTGPRTAWYFSGRDKVNLWTGDTVRDWFRPCTLLLNGRG